MSSGAEAMEVNFAPLETLAPRLAHGSLSAAALLDECLAAIAAHDRAGLGLAAVTCLNPMAQAEARDLDVELRRSGVRGPLHGIPMVVKDNIDLAGLPTTSGSRAMARATPARDAEQVRRLRAAGAIIVAKTNLSEFSFQIRSRSSIGGDVRNPFDRSVTAGGSSGGTAAAIAAGFAIAGLGTDTGGSIRAPASYNGLVGLRPTHGLVDRAGVAPLSPTTDTVGPLARAVADVARLIGVMVDEPARTAIARALDGGRALRGARLGVLRQAFGADGAIGRAMEAALGMMSAAGATIVDPVALPDLLLPIDRDHIVDWEFAPAFDAYLAANFPAGGAPSSLADILASDDYLTDYRESLGRRAAVTSLDADPYRAILAYHQRLREALRALFDRHGLDALVHPTSMVTPTSLDNPRGGWAPELAACSGWPAITLPVDEAPSGIPIGLELLGPAHREARLLALAADLERLVDRRFIPRLG